MPAQRNYRRSSRASAVCLLLATNAAVAGNTWTGGGTTNNWTDVNNWGGSLPAYGTVTFTGSTRTASYNDSAFANMNQVQFNSSSTFTLFGAGLSLFDFGGTTPGKIENQGSAVGAVNFGITFAATAGPDAGEINAVGEDLIIGGTVAITGSGVNNLDFYGSGHNVALAGVISGTGKSVRVRGNNTIIFRAANTYTGQNYILNGTLAFDAGGSASSSGTINIGETTGSNSAAVTLLHPAGLSPLTISNAILVRSGSSGAKRITSSRYSGTSTLSGNVFLDADVTVSADYYGGTLTLSGTTLDLKNQTMTFTGAGTTLASGTLQQSTGSGKVVKSGSGTLILSSTSNSFTGGVTINSGTVSISSDSNLGGTSSGVTFASGGSGALRFSANPALASTRTITVTGPGRIDLGASSTINGALSGAGQLTVTGAGFTLSTSNANSGFTGAVVVQTGLALTTTTGALGSIGGLTVGGGTGAATLTLTNGTGLDNNNRLPNALNVSMASAGLLDMPTPGANLTELIGALTFASGHSTVAIRSNNSTIASTLSLGTTGNPFSRSNRATGNIRGTFLGGGAAGQSVLQLTSTSVTDLLAGVYSDTVFIGDATNTGAKVRILPWLVSDTSGTGTGNGWLGLNTSTNQGFVVQTYTSTFTSGNTLTDNIRITADVTGIVATTTVNSLVSNSSSSRVVSGSGGGNLVVTSGGIINGNSGAFSITVPALTTGSSGANELFLHAVGAGISVSSAISGTGGLTKSGTNTVTLSGNNSSLSGPVTINGGTLSVSANNNLGNSSNAVNISGGTLSVSAGFTMSRNMALTASAAIDVPASAVLSNGGALSGSAPLNKIGQGVLELTAATGNSTYSGALTVTGNDTLTSTGALRVGANETLSSSVAIALTKGGILDLNGFTQSIASLSLTPTGSTGGYNAITFGTGTLKLLGDVVMGGSSNAPMIFSGSSGALDLQGATRRFDILSNINSAGDLQISPVISNGGILKTNTGVLALLNTANTFTGGLTIAGGTVLFAADGSLGGVPGSPTVNVTLAGGTLDSTSSTAFTVHANRRVAIIAASGTFNVSGTGTVTVAGNISGNGDLFKTGSGPLILSGTNSYFRTFINAGTLAVSTQSNLGLGSVSIGGATLQFDGSDTYVRDIGTGNSGIAVSPGVTATVGGVVTGSGALTKSGSGTLVLANANTYTSTVAITGGALVFRDSGTASTTTTTTVSGGGALTLDNSGSSNNGNRIANTAGVTLNSGSFNFIGATSGASSESLGALSVASGANFVTVNPNGGSGSAVTFSSYTAPTSGNSVVFRGTGLGTAGQAQVFLTGVTNGSILANALGDFSVSGSGGFLVGYTTANGVGPLTYTTGPFIQNVGGPNTPTTANYQIDQAVSTVNATNTINLLSFAANSATRTLDASSGVLTLTAGVIFVEAGTGGAASVSGGQLSMGTNFTITTNNDLSVSSQINGTNFTKAGSANLTLSGNYAPTGTVAVTAGQVTFSGTYGTTGAVAVSSGATANYNTNATVSTVTGTGNVTIGSTKTLTFTSAATISTVFSGAGTLRSNVSGTATLSANNSGLSGGVTMAAGNLAATSANAIGTGPLTLSGTSSGSFTSAATSTTLANAVDVGPNGVGLVKTIQTDPSASAAQTLNLNGVISGGGANVIVRFSGKTDSSGLIVVGNTGNTFRGTFDAYYGTVAVAGDGSFGDPANAVTLSISSTTAGGLRFDSSFSTSRALTLLFTSRVDTNGNDVTWSGAVGGSGNTLVKVGNGALELTNATSGYGLLAVNAGIVSVPIFNGASANGPLGNSSSAVTLGTATTTGRLKYTGSTGSSSKLLSLASGGGGVVDIASAGTTLTLTSASAISGTGGLTKEGLGVLTLASTATSVSYTGTTVVNAGRLNVSGKHSGAIGAYTVNSGATLGGSGIIDPSSNATLVTILAGGTAAPGTSIGQLTVDGSFTLANDPTAVLEIEINGTNASLSNYDQLVVKGSGSTLTVNGARLNILAPSMSITTTPSATFDGPNAYKIVDVNTSATYNGNAFASLNGQASSSVYDDGGMKYRVFYNPNAADEGIYIQFNYVPEPSSGLLIGIGAIGLLRHRRR